MPRRSVTVHQHRKSRDAGTRQLEDSNLVCRVQKALRSNDADMLHCQRLNLGRNLGLSREPVVTGPCKRSLLLRLPCGWLG